EFADVHAWTEPDVLLPIERTDVCFGVIVGHEKGLSGPVSVRFAILNRENEESEIPEIGRFGSGFFDETGFEHVGNPVDFAVDFVIAIDDSDALGSGTGFENLGAAEFEIFDYGNSVSVDEEVAVSIFDDAGGFW